MNIFTEILSAINKTDSYNLIFLSHFNKHALSIHNITISEFTKYKYFILKNFLFAPTMDDVNRQPFIEIFNITQKKYLALLKFKSIVHFKLKKQLHDRIDLQFNDLDLMNDTSKITLINKNVKYQFSIFDLIKIINTSLSYDYRFFPEPATIKNPWDNSVFTVNNLYNIYFFIKKVDDIHMPILLLRFFQSNFSLKHFLDNNQLIIKNFIINNCKNLQDNKKNYYIRTMLNSYNTSISLTDYDEIQVDKLYPDKKLIHVFDEYLKMYLTSIYSYEADIRIKYRIKLNKRLKLFKQSQPSFGRKIICHDIIKLYYISNLYYKSDHKIFYFCDSIPRPDLIFVEDKSFVVDFIPKRITEYSIFPMYRTQTKPKLVSNNINIQYLFKFIKQFIFNEYHIDFIRTNGYDTIIKNKLIDNTTSRSNVIQYNTTDTTDRHEDYQLFNNNNFAELIDLFTTRNNYNYNYNSYIRDIEYTLDDTDDDDDDDTNDDTYIYDNDTNDDTYIYDNIMIYDNDNNDNDNDIPDIIETEMIEILQNSGIDDDDDAEDDEDADDDSEI